MQMMRIQTPQIKNQRGLMTALRKAPEKLTERQQQRRDQILEDVPTLKDIYDQMHQLRLLLKYCNQPKSSCRGHINELLSRIRWLDQSVLAPPTDLGHLGDVAVLQKQWPHRRLPSQNEIDPAKRLRL